MTFPGALPDADALGASRVVHVAEVASTMDVVHEEASRGAPAGLVVVADVQTAGRGRSGSPWHSAAGAGVWLTLLERTSDPGALGVMSLRLGLALARALQPLSDEQIRLKWPNDLYGDAGKLAGVLVETRWREGAVEWIAIGVGINLRIEPAQGSDEAPPRAALRSGTTRAEVLHAIVPAMREAARSRGPLTPEERASWERRDAARGQRATLPVPGIVCGIAEDGALLVHDGRREIAVASGSLTFGDADWLRRPPAPVTR